MKKRIMLIVPMLHQGGFERVCVATARLLEPFYEVYIVMFDSRDIAYDIKGLNVIDLHLGVKKDIFGKCVNVLKRTRALRDTKRKLGMAIAYSFGPTANLVNVLSAGREQIWIGIRSYMDMGNPRKLKFFLKKADRALCCSETIAQEIRAKYGYPGAVTLYNPLDIEEMQKKAVWEEARLPWEKGAKILVSMGREDDVKGFWHLIKSFFLVQKKLPETRLMIVGDGGFEEYRELTQKLGIGDYVYFTGLKKNPFPYLSAAQLYILTSYNEGFPNALIEAMALGVPVIATDCMTGPREILLKDYAGAQKKAGTMEGPQRTEEGAKEAETRTTEGVKRTETRTMEGAQERNLRNAEGATGKEKEDTGVVYGDYGVLVPNMDPVKNLDPDVITDEERLLAREIETLLKDPAGLAAYGRAALKRSADFSDGHYLKVLRQLMET